MSDVREPFRRRLLVRWSDLDSNAHMANTAYLDAVVDVRFAYFAECGFPASELSRLKLGPVVQRDELEYYRELRLHEEYDVTQRIGGLAPDASRMRLVNDFFCLDGRLAARVVSSGGWMDLTTRRLVAPPEAVRQALDALARTEDFTILEPLILGPGTGQQDHRAP